MYRLIAIAAPAILLGGCVSMNTTNPPPTDGGSHVCTAQPGQVLIGQQATAENGARALALTNSATLRWGPPGAVFTMDFRQDRVNVMYDESMTITEIRCG